MFYRSGYSGAAVSDILFFVCRLLSDGAGSFFQTDAVALQCLVYRGCGTVETLCPFRTVGIGMFCHVCKQCIPADFTCSGGFGFDSGIGSLFPCEDGRWGDAEFLRCLSVCPTLPEFAEDESFEVF